MPGLSCVHKLAHFGDSITVMPGETSDRSVIERAVHGCDAVLTVLAPWGVRNYSSPMLRSRTPSRCLRANSDGCDAGLALCTATVVSITSESATGACAEEKGLEWIISMRL